MGFFKRGDQKKLSSLEVARRLEELFVQRDPEGEIKKMTEEFAIIASDMEAYLCLVSLYLLVLTKVLRSGRLRVAPSIATPIIQSLQESLLSQVSPMGLLSMEADAVPKRFKEITRKLSRIWEEGRDEAPGPDWSVAKEVCFLLNGRAKEPPPGLVFKFSSLVTNYVHSVRELFERLEKEYLFVR